MINYTRTCRLQATMSQDGKYNYIATYLGLARLVNTIGILCFPIMISPGAYSHTGTLQEQHVNGIIAHRNLNAWQHLEYS